MRQDLCPANLWAQKEGSLFSDARQEPRPPADIGHQLAKYPEVGKMSGLRRKPSAREALAPCVSWPDAGEGVHGGGSSMRLLMWPALLLWYPIGWIRSREWRQERAR